MTDNKINKKLGLYCSAVGIVFYLFVILKIIMQLPVKTGTLILFSWPILPGIIGGYIFYRIDKNESWGK